MNEALLPTSEPFVMRTLLSRTITSLDLPGTVLLPRPSCSSLKVWHICNALNLSVVLFEIRHQLGVQFADFRNRCLQGHVDISDLVTIPSLNSPELFSAPIFNAELETMRRPNRSYPILFPFGSAFYARHQVSESRTLANSVSIAD
jgi:hypothetical protein